MYLGSVKFYKHLIYITIIVISVLAVIGLIFLIGLIIPDSNAAVADSKGIINDAGFNEHNNNQNPKKEADSNIFNNQASSDKSNEASGQENVSSEQKNELNKPETDKDQVDGNFSEVPEVFENYPDLYCEKSDIKTNDLKTAYITFDDGPSSGTEKILDILKEYNIKATFFVNTGNYKDESLDLLKTIADEGHTVGIHSHTHIYKEIYDSKESYLEDLNNSFNVVYEKTKIKPNVIRFPGGSINGYNSDIYEDITTEVLKRNFIYYDWNVSFEDAKNNTTADEIYKSASTGIEKNNGNNLIILAHDKANNDNTLEALKNVIDLLISYGYSFDKLDNSIEPITFSYK